MISLLDLQSTLPSSKSSEKAIAYSRLLSVNCQSDDISIVEAIAKWYIIGIYLNQLSLS